MPGEWDPEAENWVRWARTPDFDAYWYYRDAFFDSRDADPTAAYLVAGGARLPVRAVLR